MNRNGDIYVALVKIRTPNRTLQQGETITGISDEEVEYLLENGYAEEIANKAYDLFPTYEYDFEGEPMDDFEDKVPEFLTEEQLNKLSSKKKIIEYAESIGLSGLNEEEHKTELIDKVLVYISEVVGDRL